MRLRAGLTHFQSHIILTLTRAATAAMTSMPSESENTLVKAIDRWENEGGALRPADELILTRVRVAPGNAAVGEDLSSLKRERK